MAELRLNAYLGALARRRFGWADANCFTICADWVLAVTGRDPAAPWRGRVSCKADGLKLLRAENGPLALADKAMATIGAPRTDNARAGDVALVWAPVACDSILRQPTGAICIDATTVAVLTVDRGLAIAQLPFVRAWSVIGG